MMVLVLKGGPDAEREVSLRSGGMVAVVPAKSWLSSSVWMRSSRWWPRAILLQPSSTAAL